VSAEPSALVVGAFHVSDTDAASAQAAVRITPARVRAAMTILELDLAARRVGDLRSAPPVMVVGLLASPKDSSREAGGDLGKRGARQDALQDGEK
jgi:hypothetical protein